MNCRIIFLGFACFVVLKISAAEMRVRSAEDISRLALEAKPGDVLMMEEAVWTNQVIVFKARGTAEKPITLRASSPGKVALVGASSLTIDGEHVVANGISVNDGRGDGDAIKVLGRSCRLTECAVIGGVYKFYVHLYGMSNRVDHCYLAGKTNVSPTMQIEVERQPNHHLVDYNHFGPRPPLRKNGGETLRVGYSHQSMSNSCSVVEHNLFDRCDGEIEIISNKSCENIYRFNTFLDCAGMLTLRHGNRCRVESNFFIGHHKRGSGGIRVIGEDHVIINNYIEGVENGGFWITAGISNSPLNGYFQARNCLIAFNTFVDSRGAALQLDAGIRTARRTLLPEAITIANNVFSPSDAALLKGTSGEGWMWEGNIASVAGNNEHSGIRVADLKLERASDGLWHPMSQSPVRGAAEGYFAQITSDIDGQPRTGKLDVGCDQISDAPIKNRPFTAKDVGPSWRN